MTGGSNPSLPVTQLIGGKKEKEKRETLFLISYGVYSLHLISITPSSYYLELKKYTRPLKQAEPFAE